MPKKYSARLILLLVKLYKQKNSTVNKYSKNNAVTVI